MLSRCLAQLGDGAAPHNRARVAEKVLAQGVNERPPGHCQPCPVRVVVLKAVGIQHVLRSGLLKVAVPRAAHQSTVCVGPQDLGCKRGKSGFPCPSFFCRRLVRSLHCVEHGRSVACVS